MSVGSAPAGHAGQSAPPRPQCLVVLVSGEYVMCISRPFFLSLFRGRLVTWQPAPLRSGVPVALRAPFVFSASLSPSLYTWPRATAGAPLMTYVTTSTLMLPAESHHLREAGITLVRQFFLGSLPIASTDVVFVVLLLISDRLLFLCWVPWISHAPPLSDAWCCEVPIRTSVHPSFRDMWSRCLIAALASVIAHRNMRAWTDLLALSALPLGAVAVTLVAQTWRSIDIARAV